MMSNCKYVISICLCIVNLLFYPFKAVIIIATEEFVTVIIKAKQSVTILKLYAI